MQFRGACKTFKSKLIQLFACRLFFNQGRLVRGKEKILSLKKQHANITLHLLMLNTKKKKKIYFKQKMTRKLKTAIERIYILWLSVYMGSSHNIYQHN